MSESKQDKIARLKTGYFNALDAAQYMPIESRPYTYRTADNYLTEIRLLIPDWLPSDEREVL